MGESGKTTGSDKRAENRKKKQEKISIKALECINLYLKELTKSKIEIDSNKYNLELGKLIEVLKETFPSLSEYIIANNTLAYYINEGNKEDKWDLDVPEVIVEYKGKAPLRDPSWFKTAKHLNELNKIWLQQLDTDQLESQTDDISDVLTSVLISAAFYGGLCVPKAIIALANLLNSEKSQLIWLDEGKVWIDIIFNDKTQSDNIRDEHGSYCLRRWYPDTITLAWIYNYLNSNNSEKSETTIYYAQSIWSLIKNKLKKIDINCASKISTFNSFCKSSIGVVELRDGVELNQALVNYSIGNIPSSSLSKENHLIKYEKTIKQIGSITYSFFNTKVIKNSVKVNTNKVKAIGYEKVIKKIKEALKLMPEKNLKNTQSRALIDLNELLEFELTNPTIILVEWIKYLLGENRSIDGQVYKTRKKIKVSSANTYYSAIGEAWLAFSSGIDVLQLDENDFENLYSDIVDCANSDNSKQYNLERLEQFHTFCTEYFGFPPLYDFFKSKLSNKQQFVSSGFITEEIFSAMRSSIQLISDLDELAKNGLESLLIIAYRTGLRRGELLKLRFLDIEKSDAKWLFIRNNKYGNNKSSTSLRKVLMIPLLTSDEAEFVNKYLDNKFISVRESLNSLVFSLDQSPNVPLKAHSLSGLIKSIFSNLFDEGKKINFVFHHLRHSALSRLQIILENEKKLIKEYTIYSQVEISTIQWAFGGYLGRNFKDIYWSISGLAGHRNPKALFTSYLHFTDRILGERLQNHQMELSRNAVLKISNISKNLLTGKINKSDLKTLLVPLSFLKELVLEKIIPYCNQVENIKKTKHEIKGVESIEIKDLEINKTNLIDITPTTCMNILLNREAGEKVNALSERFNLTKNEIEKLIRSAKNISEIHTSKNKQRFFAADKILPLIGYHLAPVRPNNLSERDEANKAFSVFQEFYPKAGVIFKEVIDHFKENSTTSSSGIKFKDPKDLRLYMVVLIKMFNKNRLKLYFTPLKLSKSKVKLRKKQDNYTPTLIPEQKEQWVATSFNCEIIETNNTVGNDRIYPYGKVELHLIHPDSSKIIKKVKVSQDKVVKAKTDKPTNNYTKFTSNLPSYLIHMFAILIDYHET